MKLIQALEQKLSMSSTKKVCVWWVKQDCRLNDNEALYRACEHAVACGSSLLIAACLEPSILISHEYGPRYYAAKRQALQSLQNSLKNHQQTVLVFTGEATDFFTKLLQFFQVTCVIAHQETSSDKGYKRDISIRSLLASHKVPLKEYRQQALIRGLKKRDHRLSEARRPFEQGHCLPVPNIPAVPSSVISQVKSEVDCREQAISTKAFFADSYLSEEINLAKGIQETTEPAALETLESFFYQRGLRYSGGISSPNEAFAAGSRLSVHLAHGTCSLRQVFSTLNKRMDQLKGLSDEQSKQWRRSLNAFRSRLYWRDHFIQRLETEVEISYQAINPAFANIRYDLANEDAHSAAFFSGRTGFPIIDACMRCLTATGFLNFRMRALVTNFASFGLHLPFLTLQDRLGRLFTDYEPGIHFSQVQMQAGIVGINTIRVYSPLKQLLDQDPEGIFVRRWLPELEGFGYEQISTYEISDLGAYPKPCVDFNARAKDMKAQIFAIKRSEFGKSASLKVLEKHGSQRSTKRKRAITETGVKKPRAKKAQGQTLGQKVLI